MLPNQSRNTTAVNAKHSQRRGFTLIELMIVVAIVGVLAAVAVFGVSAYINHAKTAESKQTVGAIARAAVAAFEQEHVGTELLAPGVSATNNSSGTLCESAQWVPLNPYIVRGKKYQPNSVAGQDFNTGSTTVGWRCLKFSMSQPISYAYNYKANFAGSYFHGDQCSGSPNFYAIAQGNVDADMIYSSTSRCGKVVNSKLVLSTQLYTVNEGE